MILIYNVGGDSNNMASKYQAAMSQKYDKIFKDRVKNVHGDEYDVVGNYVNHKTRIRVKHNICETELEVFPSHFVKKQVQCPNPECRHNRMMERYRNGFYKRLEEQGEFEAISEYNGIDEPMMFRCKKCGCEFKLNKACKIYQEIKISHCPDCYFEVLRVQEEEKYKERLRAHYGDEFVLYGSYHGCDSEIEILHTECGHVSTYYRAGRVFTDYLSPCRWCNTTNGEKSVMNCLDKLGVTYEFQKKYKDLRGKGNVPLSYDFYVPSYNLLIEYQGEFHDGTAAMMTSAEFESQKERDKKKKEYAQNNDINLLEIWYWDFGNIEKILADYFNSADSSNKKAG